MPSVKDLILLSPHNSSLIHDLEEENFVIGPSSADKFFSGLKDDYMGAARRRNPTRFSEAFTCDDFRMYEFKVRRCMRGRSHDWTDCPFAHPGEKARRRDPRKIHYSGSPCPDFRKGSCRRGDACEYAHGVFECWLHPARYRTQPCKDGKGCMRRVCFFAHSMQQLRHVAVPVEESLTEKISMVESHAQELESHTQDLASPLQMVLSDGSVKGRVCMVDSHEYDLGLPLQENLSVDRPYAGALPTNSPCGAGSLVAQDVCANVGSISEVLSMLTYSSQNVSSSPFDAVSTMGFSSNNAMGAPLDMVTMVHPPYPNFPSVAPRPSDAPCETGAISQNDSFTFECSSALSSSNSHNTCEHSSYVGKSPSQQAAAWQNFLMRECYNGGGESSFNAIADDLFDMVHYRDAVMLQGYVNAIGRGRCDANEVASELNGAPISISSYNAYGSYGLSSPTSTLAGPLYPSPFSSPPLSPLSTPRIETTNVCSSRVHCNTSTKTDGHIQNRYCVKEVEFERTFTDQQSLHSHHHSQLLEHGRVNTVLPLQSPSFFQYASGQNKWSPCNIWNSESVNKCDFLQLAFDDMQHKICGRFGRESPAENGMPDLGWVHELVM